MKNRFPAAAAALLALLPAPWGAHPAFADGPADGSEPDAPLVWGENYLRAIEEVQRTGKLLMIHHTWMRGDPEPEAGPVLLCYRVMDALPATSPDLVEEIRRHCVCLRVVVRHLDEVRPQGPAGPYRYEPTGVPYLIVKDYEGNQLVMGACADDSNAESEVRRHIERYVHDAISRHPPYIPPVEAARAREQLAQFRQGLEAKQYRRASRVLQGLLERPPEQTPWSERPDDLHPVLREIREGTVALNAAAAELLAEAKRQEEAGDLRRALPNYRKVAEEFPDDCPSVAEATAAVARLSPGGSGAR